VKEAQLKGEVAECFKRANAIDETQDREERNAAPAVVLPTRHLNFTISDHCSFVQLQSVLGASTSERTPKTIGSPFRFSIDGKKGCRK
jgi:hypothetical protein